MSEEDAHPEFGRLREVLEREAWRVDYRPADDRSPGPSRIVLTHELSGERSFSVPDETQFESVVSRILGLSEIKSIRERPKALEHATLLGRLRVTGLGNRLPREAMADIGSVLRSVGLISEAEEDWLAMAGAAWSEDATD